MTIAPRVPIRRSPAVRRSVLGYGFKSNNPALLRVTVDADGKRTFDHYFIFGAGSVSWRMPNDPVRLVDICDQRALEPYLPKTRLTRAEIAEKLGVENLEIVD